MSDIKNLTREEALANFRAAKAKKQQMLQRLEKRLRTDFEHRTGQKATHFSVL